MRTHIDKATADMYTPAWDVQGNAASQDAWGSPRRVLSALFSTNIILRCFQRAERLASHSLRLVCALLGVSAAWLFFCPTSAQARYLFRGDISLHQVNRTWKEIRTLLRKHNHPQSRALFRVWTSMREPSQPIVPFAPKGFLNPEWFADARAGKIWINVTYFKSLRRQFNNAVFYQKQRIYDLAALDLFGAAWGEVWRGVVAMQHRRRKLRLLFAIKLLPGFEYARCRAHLQGLLQQRHGVTFSEETFEVALLCLQHKRRVYQALRRHPILRRVWDMVPWKLSDRPLQRLMHQRPILPARFQKALTRSCPQRSLREIVAYGFFVMRRFRCSFCPAYSLHPTHTTVNITLTKRGPAFLIDREHYRSLVMGPHGEMLRLLRKQWLVHARYNNTFLRELRAKGRRHLAMRSYYERNLMVGLVRRYNRMIQAHIQLLRQPWTARTIRSFYKRLLLQRLHTTMGRLSRCAKAVEGQWIRYATPYLYQLIHP